MSKKKSKIFSKTWGGQDKIIITYTNISQQESKNQFKYKRIKQSTYRSN